MFQASMPSKSGPADWPAPPPPPSAPGDFTLMFQPQAPIPPASSAPPAGEFTRLFHSPQRTDAPPLPGAPATAFPPPGAPATAFPPPGALPPQRSSAPTGATGAFAVPAAAPPSSGFNSPQGPSEYTRMISVHADAPLGAPAASAAPAPAAGSPQMPPMPQMPHLQQPQMPHLQQPVMPVTPHAAAPHMAPMAPPVIPRPAMPQPPAAVGMLKPLAQNNLLLAILGVLAAVVGGPIVFLLMRH